MSEHNNVQRKLQNFDKEASEEIWKKYYEVKQLYDKPDRQSSQIAHAGI